MLVFHFLVNAVKVFGTAHDIVVDPQIFQRFFDLVDEDVYKRQLL